MPVNADKVDEYRKRLTALRAVLTDLDGARREASAVVELDQTRTGRLSRMDALQAQPAIALCVACAQARESR